MTRSILGPDFKFMVAAITWEGLKLRKGLCAWRFLDCSSSFYAKLLGLETLSILNDFAVFDADENSL